MVQFAAMDADKPNDAIPAAPAPNVIDYQTSSPRPLGPWVIFMRWVGILGLPVVAGATQVMMWLRWERMGFFVVEAFGVVGLGLAVISLIQIDQLRQSPRKRKALLWGAGLTFVWSTIAVLVGLTFVVR
jgi:hypothetical protein